MAKEKVEEKKEIELCALPKQFIQSELNKLVNDNLELFKRYDLLVQALNAPVQFIDKSESTDDSKQ